MSLSPIDEAAALRAQAAALVARANELDPPPVPDPIPEPAAPVAEARQPAAALPPLEHGLDTAALLSSMENPRSGPEITRKLILAVAELQNRI